MNKSNRELEKIVKGFANHRRLEILQLLGREPGLSVQDMSEKLKSEFKNISAHVSKMQIAGLVYKKSHGNMVRHTLTNRGKSILKFVRIIE